MKSFNDLKYSEEKPLMLGESIDNKYVPDTVDHTAKLKIEDDLPSVKVTRKIPKKQKMEK